MNDSVRHYRGIAMSFALLSCLLWSLVISIATENPQATMAYEAALKWFKDKFYPEADKAFAEFAQRYPEAPQVSEALLYQAQARFELKQFDKAVEVLTAGLPKAGALADHYYYWIAESEFARQNYRAAAAAYRQLIDRFPDSKFRLKSSIGEAFAEFHLKNLDRAIELLTSESGAFRQVASASTNDLQVVPGYLLLGEAYFEKQNYRAAEASLEQLEGRKLGADSEFRRQLLMATSAVADNRPDDALRRASNAVVVARSAGMRVREAIALGVQARVLEEKDPNAAIEIYRQIAGMKEIPASQTRNAALKVVELLVKQDRSAAAIEHLQQHLAGIAGENPQAPVPSDSGIDTMRLVLGELQLKAFYRLREQSTNAPIATLTNLLHQSKAQFDTVLAITNSVHAGKAHLNRGWCLWEEAKLAGDNGTYAAAQSAFQSAVSALPISFDQATARLKLADCHFERRDFTNALAQYKLVLSSYGDFPEAKRKLFDTALYQTVRTSIELNDLPAAEQALKQMLAEFGESSVGDDALFLYGQALLNRGRAEEARVFFADFQKRFPKSELLPKVQLAVARSYVDERNWSDAIAQYEQWMGRYTNHVLRAQAEWDRAWTFYRANQETNALPAFTNFVARFPENPLAPLARYWAAEYYYRSGDFQKAELHYALVETMAPGSELSYRARLMAAKSALLRDKPSDARGIVTKLIEDRNCHRSVLPEAYFLLGDIMLTEADAAAKETETQGLSNTVKRFEQAIVPFEFIAKSYPTNRLEPLARGKIANCYLQLAGLTTNNTFYSVATNEYSKVIASPYADVSTRSQAEVGLATVLERQAEHLAAGEQQQLLRRALEHHMNVLLGTRLQPNKGEQPDAYWMQRAGLAAGRLAERLRLYPQAVAIYERLHNEIPALRPSVEKKLKELQEQLRS